MLTAEAQKLEKELAQFCGSERLHHPGFFHQVYRFLFTDGVKYLADQAGAYWLIDAIGSYQPGIRRRHPLMQEFQIWTLEKRDQCWLLTGGSDTGDQTIIQEIEYSNFPLDSITLYLENELLCLPQER